MTIGWFLASLIAGIAPMHHATVTLSNGRTIQVDVARTQVEKQRGLIGHKPLTDNQGMLFIYPAEQSRSFWMKNMSFPIDIVFFDKHKQVVNIYHNATPCKKRVCPLYHSIKAQYVLETNAGGAKRLDLTNQTTITHMLFH